VNERSSAVEW